MSKAILTILFLCYLFNVTSAQQQTVGLFQNDSTAFQGYTILSPNGDTTTYLIDNCGDVVHTWHSQYVAGLYSYLQEDGRLLKMGVAPVQNFQAGGRGGIVQILDWDSNVLWEYSIATDSTIQHHDCRMMPNGNVLVLQWHRYDSLTCIENGRDTAFIPDGEIWTDEVVEYQPIGADSADVVWVWDFWDHLIQDFDSTKLNYGNVSDHPELIDFNYYGFDPLGRNDWLHCNAISYNDSLDQIVISSRHMSEVYIIDHSTTMEESRSHAGGSMGKGGDFLYRWGNPAAYRRGTANDQKLFTQHDSYWIPYGLNDGGKIMIFNNGPRPSSDFSSVDVLEPPKDSLGNYVIDPGLPFGPLEANWQYTAPAQEDFYGQFISGAQRLPNGNTLICNGPEGRIFEIDTANITVWAYVNPVLTDGTILSQGDTIPPIPIPFLEGKQNLVFRAYRYGVDYPGFNGHILAPYTRIEINPTPSLCDIALIGEQENLLEMEVFPNPASDYATIEILTNMDTEYTIANVVGQVVSRGVISYRREVVDTHNLSNGLYFVKVKGYQVKKILVNH